MGAFIRDKIRCRTIMGASTFDHTYNEQVFYSTQWGQNGALECTRCLIHMANPSSSIHFFFICQSYLRESSKISSLHNFCELTCCVIDLSLSWSTCKHVSYNFLPTYCWIVLASHLGWQLSFLEKLFLNDSTHI